MGLAGKFLTLEGGEGTGKSTLIAGLRDYCSSKGIDVITTREPGGTVLAEQVRDLALTPPDNEPWSPLAHALLMNTSRDDHLNKLIRPALMQGAWVICDRFADSTRAYQSIDGVDIETLLAIEATVVGDTHPDLTIILDGAPEALADRRIQRDISDVFEDKNLAFHEKVRSAFLSIAEAEPERCMVIDALQSAADVKDAAIKAIGARVGWP